MNTSGGARGGEGGEGGVCCKGTLKGLYVDAEMCAIRRRVILGGDTFFPSGPKARVAGGFPLSVLDQMNSQTQGEKNSVGRAHA